MTDNPKLHVNFGPPKAEVEGSNPFGSASLSASFGAICAPSDLTERDANARDHTSPHVTHASRVFAIRSRRGGGLTLSALILVMLITPVMAQRGDPPNLNTTTWQFDTIATCREYFSDLPTLAARLKVPPLSGSYPQSIVLRMCNGDKYSLTALINAVLDRLDKASALPDHGDGR